MIALTVPDTLECIGADIKASVSPILVPTKTCSFAFTVGLHGAPMCIDIGILTILGKGSLSTAQSSVFLQCSRCTEFNFFNKITSSVKCRIEKVIYKSPQLWDFIDNYIVLKSYL